MAGMMQITFRADAALVQQAAGVADAFGMSQAEFVRRAVAKFVADLDSAPDNSSRFDLLHAGLTAAKAFEREEIAS